MDKKTHSQFAHVVRDTKLEATTFTAGGPIVIATLAGEARWWSETTPHEFKAFPVAVTSDRENSPQRNQPFQWTLPRASDPSPLRVFGKASQYDGDFLRSRCPHCTSGNCDMRVTGHWVHRDGTAPDGVTL